MYTNHSKRATGATILSKNMFGAAQIMAVTGHKSVQSLSVYQRVDDSEKILMGHTLSKSLLQQQQLAIEGAAQKPALSAPTEQVASNVLMPSSSSNVEWSDATKGIDLNEILCDFHTVNSVQTSSSTTTRQHTTAFYGNATIIHNLTINK